MLLAVFAASGAFAQSTPLAITGVKIEIGDGRVIANGNIVIQNGKIVAVGEGVAIPSGATTIDGKGVVVYPGFIDAYTTEGLKLPSPPTGGTPPSNRDTAPASMWHGNPKGMRPDIVASKCLDLKGKLSDNYAQGITTALLSGGSGSVRGIATVIDYIEEGSILVPSAAGELSFRGGGGGGGAAGGYPGTLFGTVATLRQELADAQYYAAQKSPKKDDGLENLRPLVAGRIPALFAVSTAREISRAARIADEFNLRFIVTGGGEAYRSIDLLKKKNAAVILSPDLGYEPSVKVEDAPDATPQEVLDERHATWVEKTHNAKALSEAGIPIAFSTGGSGLGDFLANVRKTIGAGLPREAALKALTSDSAKILGISDRVGTIEVGKLANLVIMTGDFADEKSQVSSVLVEGKKFDLKKGGKK
ncbi:amidohydrolase family protein [Fimbriimonas ginsengisoli]|uniref:Amidohydrolase-related domain-containing protein n=1 Tax=Fimbriimonas ginsengisoli Gsoil 348 TaxID=661478 RepID=A0A068NQF3_FIMGI|nr:amidohydrolase family protein [Fimbriimonas ginsengisoli]AIE85798.1 hypothetical protein OP10G_2430 [Fimbriimonas ginsengisoli Gsoil 348]